MEAQSGPPHRPGCLVHIRFLRNVITLDLQKFLAVGRLCHLAVFVLIGVMGFFRDMVIAVLLVKGGHFTSIHRYQTLVN